MISLIYHQWKINVMFTFFGMCKRKYKFCLHSTKRKQKCKYQLNTQSKLFLKEMEEEDISKTYAVVVFDNQSSKKSLK